MSRLTLISKNKSEREGVERGERKREREKERERERKGELPQLGEKFEYSTQPEIRFPKKKLKLEIS